MDRIRTFLIFALTLPLIGALAVGCNTGTEEPAAPQTEAAANTADAAEAAAAAADVVPDEIHPSRFPELEGDLEAAVPDTYGSDLPVYPGSVPAQGRGESSEDGDVAALQLLTNDPPEKAFGYYQDELESKGWNFETQEEATAEEERSSISVTKDGCKAIFMFVPSESGAGTDIFSISSCDEA